MFGGDAVKSFTILAVVRLRGEINRNALDQAASRVAAGPTEIPLVDLQHLPKPDRLDASERALIEAFDSAFELAPALPRARLFRLKPADHVLAVAINHIVAKGRTARLLIDELASLYSAFATGAPPDVAALHERAERVVPEAQNQLDGRPDNADEDFWRAYLADLPAPLDLPADRPRPPRRMRRGASRSRRLVAPVGDRIESLARAEGVAPFHALLAAFTALASRLTGSTDIVVGVPSPAPSGGQRDSGDGALFDGAALRVDCAGSPVFRDFVRRVHASAGAALSHAAAPFETLLGLLNIKRDPSYHPIVQLSFEHRVGAARWHGLEATPIDWRPAPALLDVAMTVESLDGGMLCTCLYDTALWDADSIDRLLERWERLLVGIVGDPKRSIDDYDLLSADERLRETVLWNDTVTAPDLPACVHHAVAAAASRTPDAVAAVHGTEQLTYEGLQRIAARLAARLGQAGVSIESRVAVATDRTLDLVVALLGTLQAGAAYVPLDADASAQRLTAVLRDAGAACIVTSAARRASMADLGLPVVEIDDTAPKQISGPHGRAAASRPAPGDSLAYVMYTSGTTGEPKGVAVGHAAVTNLLSAMRRAVEATPADALLAITPITFDIAGLEIFLPLITGAKLVVAPAHTVRDGADLRKRLAHEHISLLQATPATWQLLLDTGWRSPPGFHALCGGEPLPQALARQLVAAAGHAWNCYGPTETTIWSTLERLQPPDAPVTVGRPIANTSVYILDRRFQPVPVGVLGDLYIAGDGLARGYLGRPALTASHYLPDPFGRRAGSRAYMTGDLVRYQPNGKLDCRGRRDHQIKLHGRRIEMEAIRHVMDAHPGVQESVVVLREDPRRGSFLAAYVAPAHPAGIARAELRQHLSRHLPSYMAPSAIVILDALPRTRHGKIDRRALPPPTEPDLRAALMLVSPRTPTEKTIAEIWRDVLNVSAIGVDDDLFALGGNSLHAVRILLLIHAWLDVDLSVQLLFDAPTVAALAAHADRARAAGSVPRRKQVPCARGATLTLAPQQEIWWYSEYLMGHVNPNNVHIGFRLAGPLCASRLSQAVAALQRRHEPLRMAFVVDEHSKGVPVILPLGSYDEFRVATIDLSLLAPELQARMLDRVSRLDHDRPFDLAHETLARISLVRLGHDDHVILLTMPHLISDGWSVDVLVEDLSTLYTQYMRGSPAHLPELLFQYVDFAEWQRDWLSGPDARAQVEYWRQQLAAPLSPLLPEPTYSSAHDGPHFSIRGRVPIALAPEALAVARRLARREQCTLFAIVMTALKLALHFHTNQSDIRVATIAANRGVPGTERLVGLFANVICLRSRVEDASQVADLIRAVHRTIGSSAAHQDLPFESFAATLRAEQGISRPSLFQVSLIWEILSPDVLRFPGVDASLYRQPEDDFAKVLVRNTLELRFELVETPSGVSGVATYDMSYFTAAQIRELVDAIDRSLILAEGDAAITVGRLCGMLRQSTGVAAPASGIGLA